MLVMPLLTKCQMWPTTSGQTIEYLGIETPLVKMSRFEIIY